MIKKPLPRKDKKTIVMSAESFLEQKTEDKKEKHGKGENLLTAINNMKLKDPSAYLPTTLPFKFLEDDTKTLDLNENDQYLFQFPRILPMNLDLQRRIKDEELDLEEPTFDQSGYLIKTDFENIFKSLPKNTYLGKLKIYKSGKIKMHIGNTVYDITAGINCKFAQELAAVYPKTHETFFLGKIREKKLIVTPELNI